ncbi:MAG: antibiotic biosynthesis monooxygenase family protein [Acidimicrobiales bacterium]
MWAQLITMRLKPGKDAELATLLEALRDTEQPGSGLIRSTTMRDQSDPLRVYTLVVFESEARARERENDARREAGLASVRAMMAEVMDGPAEFTNLDVVTEG